MIGLAGGDLAHSGRIGHARVISARAVALVALETAVSNVAKVRLADLDVRRIARSCQKAPLKESRRLASARNEHLRNAPLGSRLIRRRLDGGGRF